MIVVSKLEYELLDLADMGAILAMPRLAMGAAPPPPGLATVGILTRLEMGAASPPPQLVTAPVPNDMLLDLADMGAVPALAMSAAPPLPIWAIQKHHIMQKKRS